MQAVGRKQKSKLVVFRRNIYIFERHSNHSKHAMDVSLGLVYLNLNPHIKVHVARTGALIDMWRVLRNSILQALVLTYRNFDSDGSRQ